MTVIVWRDGIVAADSACTDSAFQTSTQKIHRRRGTVIGFAGDVAQALVFVDWYFDRSKARAPERATEGDWEAIVVTKKGAETWDPSLRPVPVTDRFYAIGSGAAIAMGAMEAGAKAREAVAIACRRDPYCRLPVIVAKV